MAISWTPTDKDFQALNRWGLGEDPFEAVKDYSDLKKELRWLNPDHRNAWEKYIYTRAEQIGKDSHEEYYRYVKKPIDKLRWEYLKLRKSWFIMPLGWENFTKASCTILDAGCGDGDTVQRIIDYVYESWKNEKIINKTLHIIGIDLNESRIENANNLVSSPDPRITFEFRTVDVSKEGIPFDKGYFDFSLCTGVLEILEDQPCLNLMQEMTRTTKSGIYVEDLYDRFPGGYPRELEPIFKKFNFEVKHKLVVLSEPFDLSRSKDPIPFWPIMVDQNIWAERVNS